MSKGVNVQRCKRIENDENEELLEIIKLYYDEINN